LFACALFPFLFGVMFGDIGHGGLLFAFAIYICLNNDKLREEKSPIVPLLKVRYLFLLMGFFATYAGFIYNDFLSLPWNLFGSCWENVEGTKETE
jgi:V-type H+-transporting ATPase subunit a